MNILFFKDNEMLPHLGGISRINCNLRDAMEKRGNHCIFLSSTKREDIIPDKCQRWLPILDQINCKMNKQWLHQFICEHKVDIIVNSSFSREAICLLDESRRGSGCKLISWIHNNIVEYGSLLGYRNEMQLKDKYFGFFYKISTCGIAIRILRYLSRRKHYFTAQEVYRRSDKVITVCDGNIREFLFLLGHQDKERKLISINNFVPHLENEVSDNEKTRSVVWCGSVDYNLKKTNWMLQIWRSIQWTHPDWTLTIIGDGKQLASMKHYAMMIGVERVVFTGRVKPEPYYRRASILCSTSISESFGLTIVEGMQHRIVPVAFASSAAICDVVGYNGCLVNPFDIQMYAMELSKLMQDDSRRQILAEKGRIAAMLYDEEQMVKLWQKLFEVI